MISLTEVDEKITENIISLEKLVKKNNFDKNILITTTITCEEIIIPDIDNLSSMGIYFFELKLDGQITNKEKWIKWTNGFKTEWDKPKRKNGEKLKAPITYKGRIEAHYKKKNTFFKTMKWIPLYLGKSQELSKRINEHLNDELNDTTYSLKLGKRNFLKGKTIRVSVIEFDAKIKNYNVIAPHIERIKREDLNPIIGKQ